LVLCGGIFSMFKNIYSTRNLIVNRINDSNLLVQCSHLSTFQEALAWMSTDVRYLRIKDVGLQVYRSPIEMVGYKNFPEIVGMEAYLNSGSQLKRLLSPNNKIAWELLSECIRGIIQAESYYYRERGFLTEADFLNHWQNINKNGCYRFSHPEDAETSWFEYIGDTPRYYNLFNRSHIIHLQEKDTQNILSGIFIDSYHEINIQIISDKSNIINEANANLVRIPDKICINGARYMHKLVGHNLLDMNKKDIAGLIGGSEGCTHIVDIVHEACMTVQTGM